MMVTVEGLSKTYGNLTAVAQLELEIPRGELFGLLGPNGAGKTTVISMLAGVVTPSAGRACVGGHDIRREPFAARRLLGLVPQEIALYEELTSRQNLRFFGRLWGLSGADRDEAITWVLGVAGLSERADEPVTRFSGGMKRRLNLAVGILHRPKLLVLDEPTVGVDPQSRAHIFDTVRQLREEEGMTVLYTSHYMEEVEALCSRVGIMDQGKLVALDSIAHLVAEHASAGISLTVCGDTEAAARALESVGTVTRRGDTLHVQTADRLGEVVHAIEGVGARLATLELRDANLETVFLNLTGRSMRDGS